MSIIYDALKKADRERQPSARRVPFHPATPPPQRRGRWTLLGAVTMLVGAGSGFAMWVWLTSTAAAPKVSEPGREGIAKAYGGAVDRSADESQPAKEPSPVASPLNSAPETSADVVPSPAVTPQVTADDAFEQGRKAEEEGRWEEAVQHYRQAIALNPTLLEAGNDLGRLYVRLDRFAEAIDEFQKVLALAPDYPVARNNLGSAYLLGGHEDLAIQEFLAAIRLDSTYVTPYYNLASVYARRGDAAQAVTFLTKALALEPAVLSWVREDPDFVGVWDSPEFRRLRNLRTAR